MSISPAEIQTVIGLDLSLHSVGWFRCTRDGFNRGELDCGTWLVPQTKDDPYERLGWIKQQCLELGGIITAPTLYVIETPFQGLKGSAAFALAGLATLVRYSLCERPSMRLLDVSPSTLKQFATGKGNSEKNVVLRECYKRWGLDNVGDDAADAYVLGRIGCAFLGWDDEYITTFQRAVIEGLKNPKPKKSRKKAA